jgi:hypothetical protein
MDGKRLEYSLVDGYIHNWLVAGPQAVPVADLASLGQDFKPEVARRYYTVEPGVTDVPLERGSLDLGDETFPWTYVRCLDDHLVDLSTFYHTCHYLRAWAHTWVTCPVAQGVTCILTTNGPADVWINGQHVHRHEHFHHQDPKSVSFGSALQQGDNEILVRFEEVAARECPYAMALQIVDAEGNALSKDCSVAVLTGIERAARRRMIEDVFEQAHLEQFVHHKGNRIILHWPDDMTQRLNYTGQVQDARGRIYIEAQPEARASETVDLGHLARLWEEAYDVVLRARAVEYYNYDMRYERRMPIHVLDNAFSASLYGTLAERCTEALDHATKRGRNVYAEIAKMALGRWDDLDRDRVMEAIQGINRRGDCSDFYLVGLLGAMYRYASQDSFPDELKQPLRECVLGFKYWDDEPGVDAMCYRTENHSILFHACEVLAGQRFPDLVFSNTGQTGQWHREKGERLALEWLQQRGTSGFSEWDSNCYFEEDLVALSHLADLAENDTVREMAAVVMDKLLLTIALNSFKGVFGSTHGRTYAPMVKGGLLEPTSGITRLLWGMGVWNQHVMGTVSLACSDYEMPLVIADIAVNLAEEMWGREQHRVDSTSSTSVNKVTYRTPDYMLCSAQDYHPGEKGYQQHIWQATLGPAAVVFVTHPPNMSEVGAHRPNFWCGNYILPRVAQYKDALVAIHNLPDDDWMGFTHAYFPVYEFDEYAIDQEAEGRPAWAFARSGSGYLALTAAQGLELTKYGPSAYQELRSYGQHNVWLCLMGREATDGTFAEFQEKVHALDATFEGAAVQCTTHRGQSLSFGWEGPLVVDGEEQALSGFKHYENPYCVAELDASEIEIRTDSYLMRLCFDVQDAEGESEQEA